jgi:hypothetical protein
MTCEDKIKEWTDDKVIEFVKELWERFIDWYIFR